MRVRSLSVIVAVFGAAALAAWFVVRALPIEGQWTAVRPGSTAPPAPQVSPALEPPASPADGTLEVAATAGGEPLAGAEVRLYLAPAADAIREDGAGWRRAGAARTGADGVARVPAAPGAYLVAVRAPGLAPGRAEAVRTPGEQATRVEVALAPPVALAGRAVARGGGPLAVQARAFPVVSRWPGLAPPSAPPEETASAAGNRAGAFRLDALSPGTWAIAADAPGYHPLLLPRVQVPGEPLALVLEPLGAIGGVVLRGDGSPAPGARLRAASADHGATAVAGPDGQFTLAAPAGSYEVEAVLGERAGLASAPVAIAAGTTSRGVTVRLGGAASIEGELVLAGRPPPRAEVALSPHGTRQPWARAVADAAGRFTLGGLAAGAYDVLVAAPGASPALVRGVTPAAGAPFPLRVALSPTGSIEGAVRDAAGRPLAGVRVGVVQRGDGLVLGPPLEARTGFDGRFRLDGVEAGRAEVIARQEGVALGAAQAVRVAPGRASQLDLFLGEPGFLRGRVAQRGAPPAGTTVVAVAMRAGTGTLQVARAAADASGNYELALPAGEYRVHAAPGDAVATDLRVAPSFARVDAARTARLDVPLAQPAREDGPEILVLEPGGAPSPGAIVALARPGDGRVALATSAGDDGRVALARDMGMTGRPVTIRARNGGRSGEATVTLPSSGTVAVTLAPGGALEGIVRGARGFTLEVASRPAADGWRTVDVHRFSGERFELGDVPAEPLRLAVRTEDGRRGEADVRVGPGETRTVEIALRR